MPYSVLFLFFIFIQLVTGEESWTFSNDDASHDPNDVKFYLYSNPNNYSMEAGMVLDLNNLSSIKNVHLIKNAPVKIIIHGFQKNYTCWIPQEIKDTYFERGIKANIIAVDWDRLAEPMTKTIKIVPYPDHLNNVKITGKRIAQLIYYLVLYRNVSLPQIHIIAHSVGCLVAGEAAVEVENLFGTKVGRITALDPAGSGYFPGISGRLLMDTDANFVDVIHVAVLDEGRNGPVGDVDFYMNKAGYKPQPGCEGSPICSHESAGSYWIQSIGHPEICACRRMKLCKCEPEGNGVPFGENASPQYEGSYFLRMAPVELSGKYEC